MHKVYKRPSKYPVALFSLSHQARDYATKMNRFYDTDDFTLEEPKDE